MFDDVDNYASPYSNDRIGIELSPDLQSIKAMGSMIQASIVYIDIDIDIYIYNYIYIVRVREREREEEKTSGSRKCRDE
jgi:hypothetical protein